MVDNNNYTYYFPNITKKRRDLLENFYKIVIVDDLPLTIKKTSTPSFHPIMASYVIRDMILECIDCVDCPNFPKINEIKNKNTVMIERTIKIMDNVMNIGMKDKMFKYNESFGSELKNKYSGLTNARYYFLYKYFGTLIGKKEYIDFSDIMLDSLLIPIEQGGTLIDINKLLKYNDNIERIWIDEVSGFPYLILNGGLTCLRQLYYSYEILNEHKLKTIIDKFFNGLCAIIESCNSDEYCTSKYRLTPLGTLQIKLNNNKITNAHVTYNYMKFNFSLTEKNNFINNIRQQKDTAIVNFVYLEGVENIIEINFKNKINNIDISISDYEYKTCNLRVVSRYIPVDKNSISIIGDKIIINLNKTNAIKFIKPSLTTFNKLINNKYYNTYHYNHIDTLRYLYSKTASPIIKKYLDIFIEETKNWENQKYITDIKNVSLDEY